MAAVQLPLFDAVRRAEALPFGAQRPANDVVRPPVGVPAEERAFIAGTLRGVVEASAGRFTAADRDAVEAMWSVGGIPSAVARAELPAVARDWLSAAAGLRAERLSPKEIRSSLCLRSSVAGGAATRAMALHTICAVATRSVYLRSCLRNGVKPG